MLAVRRLFDSYALRRNVVESVDVEGGDGVASDDYVRVFESPFQPDVEEMSLDPAVAVLGILEELEFVNLKGSFACLAVCISSQGIE